MLNQPQKMQDPSLGPASPWVLFVTFTSLALQGFGGVLPVAQRMLCDQLAWLSQKEFVEMLAVAQILPGPNVCNISLMVGDRFFGWRGAFAALAGMITIPLIIVIMLCALYTQFATLPAVSGALKGMGGVAGGMIIGSAIKLASSLRSNPLGWPACLALSAAAFLMIALLRWPLVWVLLGLGIPACLYAWSKIVHDRSGYENPASAQEKPLFTDKDPLQ